MVDAIFPKTFEYDTVLMDKKQIKPLFGDLIHAMVSHPFDAPCEQCVGVACGSTFHVSRYIGPSP